MLASNSSGQVMPSVAKRPSAGRITRSLVWFHRWLGIATCLVFALWFASGAVLLFQPFPSLSRDAQMGFQRPVDLADIRVAPSEAIIAAGGYASGLRLVQYGDRPTYLVEYDNKIVALDARTGAVLQPLNVSQAQAIAIVAFGGGAATNGPFSYDQWIVHNQFDSLRPLYRIDLGDKLGTQFYLSARTGELVQRTTFHERAWNWVGAVLHWVYFTPVRSSFALWDNGVWIISFVTMLVAIAGTTLGIIRTIAAQRLRKPALSFFRPFWMRWHHILGLFASMFVLTWIFSGWLSMDHGRLFARGEATSAQISSYHGKPLVEALRPVSPASLRASGTTTEVSFDVVGGTPILIASHKNKRPALFDVNGEAFNSGALITSVRKGIAAAWPDARVRRIDAVETTDVYALAEGWPTSAVRVTLDGQPDAPAVYVDGANGRLLTVMSPSRATYAWIYYALHTFNFPGLTTRPLLRETLVMIPLVFGFIFSITGVVIGFQRLRKSFRSSAGV